MRRLLLLALLAPALLAGCDSVADCPADADCLPDGPVLLVGNQGNFTENNGTVSTFPLRGDSLGTPATYTPGGLVQALVRHGGRTYVLLNFSDSFSTGRGRIDVLDEAGALVAQHDVGTPRAMAVVGSTAYVTDLYADRVARLDLATGAPAGAPLAVGANPEGAVAVGSRVYVADYGFGAGSTVSVIDAAAGTALAPIEVGCDGPRTLLADAEGEVWVFCTGNTVYDPETYEVIERTNGAVVVLDGATGAERARFALDGQLGTASFGQDAALWPARREAYAVREGATLLRFDTAANAPAGALAPALPAGHTVGAVGVVGERLAVTTVPPDFVSAGSVLLVDAAGAVRAQARAGLIPSAVVELAP